MLKGENRIFTQVGEKKRNKRKNQIHCKVLRKQTEKLNAQASKQQKVKQDQIVAGTLRSPRAVFLAPDFISPP